MSCTTKEHHQPHGVAIAPSNTWYHHSTIKHMVSPQHHQPHGVTIAPSNTCCHVFHLLGINVLFSGGVDEFSIGLELNNLLIPAFVGALKEIQPLFPYPPDPQVYQGGYTEVTTNTTAQIVTYNNQIAIVTPFGNYYLAYWEPLRFQV